MDYSENTYHKSAIAKITTRDSFAERDLQANFINLHWFCIAKTNTSPKLPKQHKYSAVVFLEAWLLHLVPQVSQPKPGSLVAETGVLLPAYDTTSRNDSRCPSAWNDVTMIVLPDPIGLELYMGVSR